jgi:hypothetical protein
VRIHVGRVELVPELIRYFERHSDCIVLQVGATEVEVSLLGSYRNDRHEAAVEQLLASFWLHEDGGPTERRNGNGNGHA